METGQRKAETDESVLFILRLISFHGLTTFPLDPGSNWNLRTSLGKGSTFLVEQANVSRWRDMYPPYRDPKHLDQGGDHYFSDHSGLRWTYRTPVAYKLPRVRDKGIRGAIRELATEIRILCHPHAKNHPNIVRLLCIAWVNEEDVRGGIGPSNDSWPIAVIEKADLGSIETLFDSPSYNATQPSLRVKFNLCVDVLRAICVSTMRQYIYLSATNKRSRFCTISTFFTPTSRQKTF
jgi:hypothetical protein